MSEEYFNNRILLCDDNRSIHADLLKILKPRELKADSDILRDMESRIFDMEDADLISPPNPYSLDLEIDHAYSGGEAMEKVRCANEEGRPYALVFMDVRMPPGPDGVKTIKDIWELLPQTEVVIVTAYSDYSWNEVVEKLGANDKLLYLRKPVSTITVRQIALNLTHKWNSAAKLRQRLQELESKTER